MLWFWDGEALGVASFCQKLFLLEAGVGRFWEWLASVLHGDSCAHRMGNMASAEV